MCFALMSRHNDWAINSRTLVLPLSALTLGSHRGFICQVVESENFLGLDDTSQRNHQTA